jgi:hypothetical protein
MQVDHPPLRLIRPRHRARRSARAHAIRRGAAGLPHPIREWPAREHRVRRWALAPAAGRGRALKPWLGRPRLASQARGRLRPLRDAERGLPRVMLNVDFENPTNAMALYGKAGCALRGSESREARGKETRPRYPVSHRRRDISVRPRADAAVRCPMSEALDDDVRRDAEVRRYVRCPRRARRRSAWRDPIEGSPGAR